MTSARPEGLPGQGLAKDGGHGLRQDGGEPEDHGGLLRPVQPADVQERPGREGKHLKGVKAHRVGHAEVAALRAPVDDRQAGARTARMMP